MYRRIDNRSIRTYPLHARESKVNVRDFARVADPAEPAAAFIDSLPDILAARDLREVARRIAAAKRGGKKFVLAMGAHVIKVGCAPLVIDLMRKGLLDAVAMNGACIIHDTEIAMAGHTSEDVAKEIKHGSFGMVKETTEFIIGALRANPEPGLGEALGMAIDASDHPYKDRSIIGAAYALKVPVTVHVAIGTDILHMHPGFDGAAFGAATHRDFLVFSQIVSELGGGVYLNLGSSVILPEVFLKAVSLVRNLGHPLADITTVNMDFIQHYRPLTNVVRRPTLEGGAGFSLTGHHEIMFPLLCAAVKRYLAQPA